MVRYRTAQIEGLNVLYREAGDPDDPIGIRIVGRHPEWLEWQVIQNSNAYGKGFTAAWDAIRHALWLHRSPDYRTNVELYPRWQTFLRERRPKTLILWGANDIFLTPEGGRAYLRDLPEAELHMLDSGHFAVEDSLDEIAAHVKRFHVEMIEGRTAVQSVATAMGTR
jgi:pimeloyl-ACP methyl ester carboxylesterase